MIETESRLLYVEGEGVIFIIDSVMVMESFLRKTLESLDSIYTIASINQLFVMVDNVVFIGYRPFKVFFSISCKKVSAFTLFLADVRNSLLYNWRHACGCTMHFST